MPDLAALEHAEEREWTALRALVVGKGLPYQALVDFGAQMVRCHESTVALERARHPMQVAEEEPRG